MNNPFKYDHRFKSDTARGLAKEAIMRPAAKYAHGIKSKAASAKASASASAKAGNYALPSCKMFPHRPWSTVCISLCHQHLASQQAAALTSQLELGNTHHHHHLSYFTMHYFVVRFPNCLAILRYLSQKDNPALVPWRNFLVWKFCKILQASSCNIIESYTWLCLTLCYISLLL